MNIQNSFDLGMIPGALRRLKANRHALQGMITYMHVGGRPRAAIGTFTNRRGETCAESVDLPSRYDGDIRETIEQQLNCLYREIWALDLKLREADGKSTLRPVLRWSKEFDGETEIVWIGA